ncbi:enoyl-CoA hydratase-related protein [Sphingomonas sp. MMS24-JH45]
MAVQGSAIGAGLGLALVGDFRVAAPEARFSASFVTLGFHAGFGITHTLPPRRRRAARLADAADRAAREGGGCAALRPRRPRSRRSRRCARQRSDWRPRSRPMRRWRSKRPARRCAANWPRACGRKTSTNAPSRTA